MSRADGSQCWLQLDAAKPVLLKDHLLAFYGTLRDITEQKESEYELAKLAQVSTNISDVVYITNTQAETQWINESITRMFGYRSKELLQQSPTYLLSGPETEQAEIDRLIEACRLQRKKSGILRLYHKDGKGVWVE